jgi:hypothetical protein
MFTFDTQHQTFTALLSDDFTQAIKDTVWYTPGLPLPPNPTGAPASTSFIMTTNIDDIDFGENEPTTPRLWKFTLSPPATSQEFDVEPHFRRIFEEKRVEFYLFCMTSGRMFFLGSRGKYPTNGFAYLGEVNL